jgi:5-methylcytosine-specific restriction endonuclease McrA
VAYIPGMEEKQSLRWIPDDELLQRLAALMGQSRRVEVDVVAHIAEVDERRLYARAAFPSMFVYCTDALRLSEQEAYLRIAVARASREHPTLLTMLADGRLHLTAIAKLAPHLTPENRDALLERATHRSKHQLEELIAEIAPRLDVPGTVRKLPERATGPMRLGPDRVAAAEPAALPDGASGSPEASDAQDATGAASAPPASRPVVAFRVSPSVVQPLSPGRYKVQFTAGAEFHRKLERLRSLMGSRVPDGDLAAVIEQAVTEKLERLEARRFARPRPSRKGTTETNPSPSAPKIPTERERRRDGSPSSRHIPAAVRRAVYQRDGGRCRYVDELGRRCKERDQLEFHHRHPFGLGGEHSVANLALMCRAHNAYLAQCDYGLEAMARHRRPGGRACPLPSGEQRSLAGLAPVWSSKSCEPRGARFSRRGEPA